MSIGAIVFVFKMFTDALPSKREWRTGLLGSEGRQRRDASGGKRAFWVAGEEAELANLATSDRCVFPTGW